MKFLFYSHDGYGLGHTARNIAIAQAVVAADPRATILLATGSDDVTRLGVPAGVEILKLPSLKKLSNQQYGSRHLHVSGADIRALRSRVLSGVVETFRPAVMLVDKHPFGAAGELRDAMERLRDQGGSAVLGFRDILDDPETVAAEWAPHSLPERITELYDRVFVYGQQEVFDSVAEYGFSEELARRTVYCGYVTQRRELTEVDSDKILKWAPAAVEGLGKRPVVLATVGGGEDGYPLLKAFIESSAGATWQGIAVTGPMLEEERFLELQTLGRMMGVAVHRFIPNLKSWFGRISALVCMGGYNTVTQALQSGVPMVCVPRVLPRREQWIRAEQFARLDLLQCVHPDQLSTGALGVAIRAALTDSRSVVGQRIRRRLLFNGGDVAAQHLVGLATGTGPLGSNSSKSFQLARV